MPDLYDEEFGEVLIKIMSTSRHVRVKVTASGTLHASIPNRFALKTLQRLIDDSRDQLRRAIQKNKLSQPAPYEHRQLIGASHVLLLEQSDVTTVRSRIHRNEIVVSYPLSLTAHSPKVQSSAQGAIKRALKQQAESYLPRQLRYLAEQYGFTFRSITFGNAKGRWGSCTSQKVIRLNIALMKLPLGLIDYVLIHELAHTRELNHSSKFWAIVEIAYPHYKSARKQLKNFSPYI